MEEIVNSTPRVKQKQKDVHNIDKVLLDQFWTLAEGDDGKRVKAADMIVRRVAELKAKVKLSCSQSLSSIFFFSYQYVYWLFCS
jgi:hypothetical protein